MSRLKLTVKQTSFDIYIVIVLFFVLPTFISVHGYTFPNKKQEEFVKSLGSYEVALPNRVTRDGKFISKEIYPHHARLKRSIENGRVAEDDVHYKINVENEDFHLELKPNYKLYNPSLVLEHRKNNFKNVSDSTFSRYHHANEHCHFVGEIRGQPSSKVALELCNGLRGLIHTHKDAYFIEPVQGHKSINSAGHPHIIYKHSSLSSLPGYSELLENTEDTDSCGNKENKVVMNFEQKRTRWEKRNRRNQSRQRRRHKRSISVERHVETLVVVDPDMMSYYKNEDVITYVLTVMNMVATLFHDASIGNAINIVVVRIMLLEDPQHDLVITNHADKSLRSFCKWQTKINMKGDEHANHHDVAVLLTRKDICARMNAPCSTLGLAQTMGMCQPHRSCNINEDTGLALAYTVAHEIGHNLGMRHDSKRNGCQLKDSDEFVYIMTAHLVAVSPLMKWSNCSKRSITKFIDRGWAYCLDDEPVKYRDSRSYEYPVLPPGTMYDGDHQCRLAYGHDAFVCEGGKDDICNTLWCRTNNKCSTKFEAAAEGTICGVNKWCFREQCVEIGDRPQAINGNWGEWSEWSSCTRTCGAGVSSRERHCDNPQPSNGGKFCIGERKRYRICNTDQCQEKKKSFRQAQCEEFNYIPFKNGLYEWEAVNTPATPCQLHCKPRNKFFSVMLRDIVTDGTPCTAGTRNMCISGRCRHIGCDWEIDSSAKEDRCGVCHGDGSTCETIKDQYNETQGFGYVEATVIPKHARNIRVEEIKEANNYLAVQNDNGEYYLNGHWFIQWSGDYDMAGTVVHYQRVGNKEKFEAVGPLKEPLHIMLLLQSHNPGVMFEYTVPKQNATDTRPRHFEWKYMDWTHCTSSCGGGTQRAEVVCVEKEAGNVDDVYCNTTTKPDDRQRACNVHLCPARWWAGPWQHCSVSCGENGVHRRTVICVRSLGSDEQIALEDKSCKGEEKPTEIEKCHHKQLCPGTAKWVTGEWSECNDNPCSNKTRSVTCEDPVIGCDKNPKPRTAVPCTNIKCGEWAIGEWSQCNTTCGAGVRHRIITCRWSAVCNVDKRPTNEGVCNMGDCPTTPSVTTVKVPVTTESMSEMTTIDIYNIAEESDILFNKEEKHNNTKSNQLSSSDINDKSEHNNNIVDSQLLNEPLKIKQSIVKETKTKNSEKVGERKSNGSAGNDIVEKVVLGNQTFEIAEGGTGEPERQVLLGSDSETKDKDNKKNKQQSEVINGSSTREQTTVSSSITSQSSNTTPQKQDILKSNKNGMKNSKNKKEKLNHHHRHGHGKKNKGDKALSVSLSDITRLSRIRGGRMGPLLPPKDPPPMSMDKIIKNRLRAPSIPGSAIVASVFEWSQRNWTVCTRQCGGGVQTRPVLCVNSKTNEEVHTARCNILTKPNAIRPCNRQICAQWQASEWSACSTTCGTAVQRRDVKCPENSYCDPKHRPSRIRTCRNPDCLAWIHGQWSKCSKTCGTGEQIRVVQCVNLTSQQQTTGCGLSTRPDEGQECNKQACPEEKSELQRSICKNNRMSDRVCRVLKKRGHCKRLFVRVNCCRECEIDKLKKNRSHRRVQR